MKTRIHWLSYGGGVNSTALAVLLVQGRFPECDPWRIVWADTQDEHDETYDYIFKVFMPWLRKHGKTLEVVRGDDGVLERWERLRVTGSRILRTCTVEAKIKPLDRHRKAHGSPEDVQLVGISAEESHRAKPKQNGEPVRFPLVEANIDRDDCKRIIAEAGLCVPAKSGCWHCPFMRVGDVLKLAMNEPDKFERIARLEASSTEAHPPEPGQVRTHWGDKPCDYWRRRAAGIEAQGTLMDVSDDKPCACWAD
jgi:hypothetical protein